MVALIFRCLAIFLALATTTNAALAQAVEGTMRLSRTDVIVPIGGAALVQVSDASSNRLLDPEQYEFRVNDPSTAVVAVDGTVTGLAEGRTELIVRGALGERSLPITVHRPVMVLASDPVKNTVVRVPQGGGIPLRAVLADENGVQVEEAELLWTMGDSSRAFYDQSTAFVIGQQLGTTQLEARAAYGRGDGVWQVEVVDAPLRLEAVSVSLDIDESYTPRAGFLMDGAVRGIAVAPRWTVSDTSVAQVVEGALIGRRWGTTTAWASAGMGAPDSLIVHVVPRGTYLVSGRISQSLSSPRGRAGGGMGSLRVSQLIEIDIQGDGERLMVLLSQPDAETECRRDFSRDAKQIIISWRSLRCDPSYRGEEVPTIRVSVLMGNTELIATATQSATISPERAVRRVCTMTQLGQTCTNVVTRDVEVTFSGRVSITKIQIAPPAVTLDPPEG